MRKEEAMPRRVTRAQDLEKRYRYYLNKYGIPYDLVGRRVVIFWNAYSPGHGTSFVRMRTEVAISSTTYTDEGAIYLQFADPRCDITLAYLGRGVWTGYRYIAPEVKRQYANLSDEEERRCCRPEVDIRF